MENKYLDEMIHNDFMFGSDSEPMPRGITYLLKEYISSKKEGYTDIVLKNICWESDRADLIALVRAAGINTFLIADTSSALSENLYAFIEAGFKVTGARLVTKDTPREFEMPLKALEITVN